MLEGVLIGESLRTGAVLEGLPLTVTRIARSEAGEDQEPSVWTMIWFQASESCAAQLAESLAGALEPKYGWYCDFHSGTEVFVVFAGRIFRYPRGDETARGEVADYARSLGVRESQLDWAE